MNATPQRSPGELRWPFVIAVAGTAVFALSFVPGWINHDRELTGEGYRGVSVVLSAWRDVALPVVAAGALVALATGLAAAVRQIRPRLVPAWLLVAGSALTLGILLASAWPVGQRGFASRVDLTPGWALLVAIVLAVAMLVASLALARPARRTVIAAGGLIVAVLASGSVGRVVGLNLEEGDGQSWEFGAYSRQAIGEIPAQTMTLAETTYRIDDRWSGTLESSGWSVVFDNDPACPDARGAYHAHVAPGGGIRFVRVVDTCLDGERGRDLEAGVWAPEP